MGGARGIPLEVGERGAESDEGAISTQVRYHRRIGRPRTRGARQRPVRARHDWLPSLGRHTDRVDACQCPRSEPPLPSRACPGNQVSTEAAAPDRGSSPSRRVRGGHASYGVRSGLPSCRHGQALRRGESRSPGVGDARPSAIERTIARVVSDCTSVSTGGARFAGPWTGQRSSLAFRCLGGASSQPLRIGSTSITGRGLTAFLDEPGDPALSDLRASCSFDGGDVHALETAGQALKSGSG